MADQDLIHMKEAYIRRITGKTIGELDREEYELYEKQRQLCLAEIDHRTKQIDSAKSWSSEIRRMTNEYIIKRNEQVEKMYKDITKNSYIDDTDPTSDDHIVVRMSKDEFIDEMTFQVMDDSFFARLEMFAISSGLY